LQAHYLLVCKAVQMIIAVELISALYNIIVIAIMQLLLLSLYHKGRHTQKAKPVQGVSLTNKLHYLKIQTKTLQNKIQKTQQESTNIN